jgi:hypothetical protein
MVGVQACSQRPLSDEQNQPGWEHAPQSKARPQPSPTTPQPRSQSDPHTSGRQAGGRPTQTLSSHVHPALGHSEPQSSNPPRPSPMMPQYRSVPRPRQDIGTPSSLGCTHMPYWHRQPVGQGSPQSSVPPQPSPISPQYPVGQMGPRQVSGVQASTPALASMAIVSHGGASTARSCTSGPESRTSGAKSCASGPIPEGASVSFTSRFSVATSLRGGASAVVGWRLKPASFWPSLSGPRPQPTPTQRATRPRRERLLAVFCDRLRMAG